MRCPHCGQELANDTQVCSRCQADLSAAARKEDLVVSLVVALVAIVAIALLTFVVLNWHDAQALGM